MNRRTVFGYLLMVVGLLLPLALLTMMSASQLMEQASYRQFQDAQKDWTKAQKKWVGNYHQERQKTDPATSDPFVESKTQEEQSPFEDGIIGYVTIPKIGSTQPIRIGASESHLERGVAQVTGTDLPVGGKGKRSVIAGHRSWYNDQRFLRIAELAPGDKITIDLGVRRLEYVVQEVVLIDATDWQQLKAKKGQDMLTLLTCNPLYPPFNERLLVNATRVLPQVSAQKASKLSQPNQIAPKKERFGLNPVFVLTGLGWLLLLVVCYAFWSRWKGSRQTV